MNGTSDTIHTAALSVSAMTTAPSTATVAPDATPAPAAAMRGQRARLLWLVIGALAVPGGISAGCSVQVDAGSEIDDDAADEPAFDAPTPDGISAARCRDCGKTVDDLDDKLRKRFDDGRDDFEEKENLDDGLGPVFNGRSCAECHDTPAVGGSGTARVTRFGTDRGGGFSALENLGGSLRQNHGIGELGRCGLPAEITPPEANVEAQRRTTQLFGLGLIDAVPDAVLLLLQQTQPEELRGVANWVDDIASKERRVGRFGWKAQVATLRTFSGDAYLNELGITSADFPDENCPQGDCSRLRDCDKVADPEDDGAAIDHFTDFMTLLAPPRSGPSSEQSRHGQSLFTSIGCAGCHVATLVTGASDIPAINFKVVHPYGDFLLHDMGSLGDGITQGAATGHLMRTAPLWGVSAQKSFLHDGRAGTLSEAIRAHDGQAAPSRAAYAALSAEKRRAVIAFLKSL